MRSRLLTCGLLAALGLSASALPAQEPARLPVLPGQTISPAGPNSNQKIANAIADQLRQSGQLRRFTVNISFAEGTAELTGSVADQTQREEVLRIVQGVPGVERVRDGLALAPIAGITQVQGTSQPPLLREPPPAPPAGAGAPGALEPTPIFYAPPPTPFDVNSPKMPPYAWPTYAPYNNFSRVAYPEAYPYNAWPFIGPMYPFPKVPPGWRSVKLEWEDGHWFFSKVGCQHDWWRIRYW